MDGHIHIYTRVDAVGVGRMRRREDGDALHHDVAAISQCSAVTVR